MGVPALRATRFDLHSYDHYLVGFSGGKDCLAATLWLLVLADPLASFLSPIWTPAP